MAHQLAHAADVVCLGMTLASPPSKRFSQCTGWAVDTTSLCKRYADKGCEHLLHAEIVVQREFEKKANPNDRQQAALIEEMRSHIKKVRLHQCCGPNKAHADFRRAQQMPQ